MKKLLLSLMLVGLSVLSFAQTFKDDWRDFYDGNFTVTTTLDSSVLYQKKAVGQLIFTHKRDANLTIKFPVFLKSEMDTAFKNSERKMWRYTGCVFFLPAGLKFSSFEFKNHYYLLTPCNSCKPATNKSCEELLRTIAFFVATSHKKD